MVSGDGVRGPWGAGVSMEMVRDKEPPRIQLPNALSHCGRYLVLSLPPKCHLKQTLGSKAPVHFVRAPTGINALHSLPIKDIFLVHDINHNIVTWNGQTGAVLHYVDHQDYGKHFSLPVRVHIDVK